MKKILLVLMALIVVLALVACGGPADETLPQNDETDPPEGHVHAYEDVITPATCTTTGLIESKCACGDVQGTTEIPLAEHTASALDCDKDTVCTVCNAVLAEKAGHTVASSEVVTAATCTSAGKEKGACLVCGKVVETDIPTAGHTFTKSSVWTLSGDNYASTCTTCQQNVVLTAQDPILALNFEEPIETEIAKYSGFNKVGAFTTVDDTDGDKALKCTAAFYIDITDNKMMNDLGAFVISFDLMTTTEAAAGTEASVFSILSNFAEGKTNFGGTTGWGYAFKLHEDADRFETIAVKTEVEKLNDSNSMSFVRNQKYNVKLVYADGKYSVFIDGKYLGQNGATPITSFDSAAKFSFRFGDGPNPGLVFDNFKICGLK